MNKTQKLLEEIKTEISGLTIRVRRMEEFLLSMPNSDEFVHDRGEDDELLESAKKLIVKYDRVSASLLQRRLMTGYARAARLLDQLEEQGAVSEGEGGKPRKVLLKKSPKSNG